jgi:hypothetical protein
MSRLVCAFHVWAVFPLAFAAISEEEAESSG